MKLREFLSFRETCPICESVLTLNFTMRKQHIYAYEDRMLFIFDMKGKRSCEKTYKVGYCFSLDDNSFHIEFLNVLPQIDERPTDHYYEAVPSFLRKSFQNFDNNIKDKSFCLECNNCDRYMLGSYFFTTSLQHGKIIDGLYVDSEYFGLIVPSEIEGESKCMGLYNSLNEGGSRVAYWKGSGKDWKRPTRTAQSQHLKIPLVPFVSAEKTAQRLDNLIIFS